MNVEKHKEKQNNNNISWNTTKQEYNFKLNF